MPSTTMNMAFGVFAAVPPLLKAKSKQQQCDSLEVWTRKAEELGGEALVPTNYVLINFENVEPKNLCVLADGGLEHHGNRYY